jgi:type I restriction enzyme S subunit
MTGVSDHARLGDVCELIKGKKPKRIFETKENGAIPYILIQSFTNSATKFTNDFDLPQCTRNDVLMVMDGASSGLVAIGVEGAIGSTLAAIRPRTDMVYPKYLYHWLKTNYNLLNRRTRGSAIPHTDRKLLQDLLVPTPPLETQKRITAVLDKAELLRLKRERANQLTNKIIQSVFLKMFGDPVTNPKGWDTRLLGEVTHKIVDGTHRTPRYVDHGIPFLTIKNIIKGEFDLTDVKYITQREHQELIKRTRPEKGDILYSKDGTLGVAKVIDIDLEFSIFVTLALIKPDRSIVDSLFLEKALNSVSLRAKALEFAKGIALRHLHLEDIKKILVPVPPMDLQAKFVSTVEKLQLLGLRQRESTQDINQLFYSVMQKAFRGELVKPRLLA